jgi:hypothetical protein
MANPIFGEELEKLREYLRSTDNEDAKRPLLYPLFQKLFKDKFKIESNVFGADIYVAGKLIVESKSDFTQWIEGFYQGLHYQKKYGLAYNTIMVIANRFVGIWKVNKIPEFAIILAHASDPTKPPSAVGKDNARKTQKAQRGRIAESAFYFLQPKDLEGDIFYGAKNLTTESYEILKILKNLDLDRIQVNTHNFINTIERMKFFFEDPIDAVHAFYTIIAYWDITSTVASNDENGEVRVIGFKGSRLSDEINLAPKHIKEFKKFIESQYIFTNEGSGLTVDYYFSRFDEVISRIDPEYVKQHGIFFTDRNLSKFALWFAKYHFPGNINENYIVFDPAGGSGNLISSWHGKLKHKIISELQPDLLRTIERRMKVDPFHIETGFTIIPKTVENKGLNFLDRSAIEYLNELKSELDLKHIQLDKPLAFLLNPPYKNIREEKQTRIAVDAEYKIHESILNLTGPDASKERYLAFIAQIINISRIQVTEYNNLHPILLIFTPTSWLIPRIGFVNFRNEFDKHFKFVNGFIITSNEFFKLDGTWPLAFTMWNYLYDQNGNKNDIYVSDFTNLKKENLNIDWNNDKTLDIYLNELLKKSHVINLSKKRGEIRKLLPEITFDNGITQRQGMQNFYRSITNDEKNKKIISGFALKDDRHLRIKAPHGYTDGNIVGFMDDLSPVRIRGKNDIRYNSSSKDQIWFRIDTALKDINKGKCFNGPTDNRSYCAYNLPSSKVLCTWFALAKALNGRYPVWANQFDIWPPNIISDSEHYWYSLCFAFVLAENRCVVTKFEKDNPVEGAVEIFVDNPLCPKNIESFWSIILDKQIITDNIQPSKDANISWCLVDKVKELYTIWNKNYCKGQFLYNVGLHDQSYFKYFNYADFLTPYSGLIQIKKYAEQENCDDLLQIFTEVTALSKKVKDEIYKLLVVDFKYFE